MDPFPLKPNSILNKDLINATLQNGKVTGGFKREYTSNHNKSIIPLETCHDSRPYHYFPKVCILIDLPSLDHNREDNICLSLSVLPIRIKYTKYKLF